MLSGKTGSGLSFQIIRFILCIPFNFLFKLVSMRVKSYLLADSVSDLVQRLADSETKFVFFFFFLIQDDISIWQEVAHTR